MSPAGRCALEPRPCQTRVDTLRRSPTSNSALGSGLFPLRRHVEAGVRVAMGSDVGAGTGFSMLKEGLQAYFMQRLLGDVLPPRGSDERERDVARLDAVQLGELGADLRGLLLGDGVGLHPHGVGAEGRDAGLRVGHDRLDRLGGALGRRGREPRGR